MSHPLGFWILDKTKSAMYTDKFLYQLILICTYLTFSSQPRAIDSTHCSLKLSGFGLKSSRVIPPSYRTEQPLKFLMTKTIKRRKGWEIFFVFFFIIFYYYYCYWKCTSWVIEPISLSTKMKWLHSWWMTKQVNSFQFPHCIFLENKL